MFITLQFPLFDYRYIKVNPTRSERPNWPQPANTDRIRYFGEILDRNKPYFGPWDDEKKYCNAHSVINLCGMGNDHFYKKFFSSQAQTRILFRRFQSDGKCMAKFEIGLNDDFENSPPLQNADAATIAKAIDEQIQQYLLCPVKIKIGNKLSSFVPLADAGDELNSAYYWATQKGKKTFSIKDIQHECENCEPVLLLQLDTSKIDISAMQLQPVALPAGQLNGMQLFCRNTVYRIGERNYNLKTWVITTDNAYDKTAVMPGDFESYNQTLRYLRINLLRIHIEIILQKKLLETFSRTQTTAVLKDPATRKRLYLYLHKIWLNLSGINRNKQPQQMLVQTAFSFDATYFGSANIDDQMKILDDYKEWLKSPDINDKDGQVEKFVDDNTAMLQQKKQTASTEITVFISYNHKDKTTADLLLQKLEEHKIKVILDSFSMPAGTKIEKFITDSIKNSSATISIVSVNSLVSGWVSSETENTLSLKEFFDEKKFIPCYLDKDFFELGFVIKATAPIMKQIKDIEVLYPQYFESQLHTTDLEDQREKLLTLKENLPLTVALLRKVKCIDMRPEQFDANFPDLLKAIKA
jgi:hypothetical protein